MAIIFKVMEDTGWMRVDFFKFGPKILGSIATNSWLGRIYCHRAGDFAVYFRPEETRVAAAARGR